MTDDEHLDLGHLQSRLEAGDRGVELTRGLDRACPNPPVSPARAPSIAEGCDRSG